MFTTILGFIGTPLGKLVSYALGIIAILSVLGIALLIHDNGIRQEATLQLNLKQLQQVTKENEDFKKKMDVIITNQEAIKSIIAEKNKVIEDKMKVIEDYLDSPEAEKADKPSSDVLKNTIRQLRGK